MIKFLRRWGWMLLTIPYMTPAVFGVLEGTELLETVFDLWRMLAAAVICGIYLRQMIWEKRRPSWVLLFLCAYLGFVGLSSVLNARNYWYTANYIVNIVTFCMLVELSLRDSPMRTVEMIVLPMTVLVLANFILQCFYPFGLCTGGSYWYSYNLMGIDNLLAPQIIPYMILVSLWSTMRTGDLDWFAYVMLGISALSLLLVWTATGMVGMAVALLFLLFFYQRRWQTLFNFGTTMLASFGLFFGVVLFRLQERLGWLIYAIFKKGVSLTGRTDIWDTAMGMIAKQPWLGYGLGQKGKVYRIVKGKYYHAHNLILEVLVEGGFLALISYLLMIGSAGRQLWRHRKHPYACLISAGLMSCGVMTCLESFLDTNSLLIYALVFLGYHMKTLIGGEENAAEAAEV